MCEIVTSASEKRKKISVTTGCFNEEENLPEFYARVKAVLEKYPQYDYEMIVADNCSTDGSRDVLRKLAAADPKFKVILNANNFGHIRSPFNAFLQATGDAVITLCSDLQEPPEVIEEFIAKWEAGAEVVVGVRSGTKEGFLMALLRRFYYWGLAQVSETKDLIHAFTGFGLYSRKFCDAVKLFHEPYPYFRGLVSEIGMKRAEVLFVQDRRKHGRTKNNFFTLYDMAMTGLVNHSKLPLRLAVYFGFLTGLLSFFIAVAYLVLKLIFWEQFSLGMAPIMIGMFFFTSVQLIFIGIIGEYLGAIWTQVKDRPLVIEEERLNFDVKPNFGPACASRTACASQAAPPSEGETP